MTSHLSRRLTALERRTGRGADGPVLWIGPSWGPAAGWSAAGSELVVERLPGESDQDLQARTLGEAARLGIRPTLFTAIDLSNHNRRLNNEKTA